MIRTNWGLFGTLAGIDKSVAFYLQQLAPCRRGACVVLHSLHVPAQAQKSGFRSHSLGVPLMFTGHVSMPPNSHLMTPGWLPHLVYGDTM